MDSMRILISRDAILRRHGEQLWGPYPYALHLQNVTRLATSLDPGEDMELLALCHDLLEDTSTSPEELQKSIRQDVILLSRNYSQGDLTYLDYVRLIANSKRRPAQVVKLCDAIVNLALCNHLGDEGRAARYERSICILFTPVFSRPLDKQVVRDLMALVSLPPLTEG